MDGGDAELWSRLVGGEFRPEACPTETTRSGDRRWWSRGTLFGVGFCAGAGGAGSGCRGRGVGSASDRNYPRAKRPSTSSPLKGDEVSEGCLYAEKEPSNSTQDGNEGSSSPG